MCSSICAARSGSSFSSSATFSSRSKSLMAYQRRKRGSTRPSMASSMWAMACSTLPSNTEGAENSRPSAAILAARSAASLEPSPLSAEVATTSQPSAAPSRLRSMTSPFLRTTSIMFTATTVGMPSSMSWVVRYRFRSIFVPSTILMMASGFSPTR